MDFDSVPGLRERFGLTFPKLSRRPAGWDGEADRFPVIRP